MKSETDEYNKLCGQVKSEYYTKKLEETNDQKTLFRIANTLLHKNRNKNDLPTHDNSLELANSFAEYFSAKIANITKDFDVPDLIPHNHTEVNSPFIEFHRVTEDEVRKLMKSYNKKSCHLDPLPTVLLHECLDHLLPVITEIINRSITQSCMPQSLKEATITPIMKKVDEGPEDMKNFRPVSNLPYLSKIIEKVIAKQLEEHFNNNSLHQINQSAYRKDHSTETALVKIMNDLLLAMDHRQCALLVFLDQSAAFDTVNQDLLLSRLQTSFGITGSALEWLTSYFVGRSQRVRIGQDSSEPKQLVTGFPQGSVLGPQAYPIYTSPLFAIAQEHNLEIHMYADDTQLYKTFDACDAQEALEAMESGITAIKQWMTANHLKLNDSKTKYMLIGNKRITKKVKDTVSTLHINETEIHAINSESNIGIIVDSSLDLKELVNNICRKCNFQIHNICKIRSNLTKEATEKLVNSLVTSCLDYNNAVLYNLPDYLLDKLQIVQNNAARLIYQEKKNCHITHLLKELHWLPIEYRIKYKINLLTYKALNGSAPEYLQQLLSYENHQRKTRSTEMHYLKKEKSHNKYGDRAFCHAAPHLWNTLPLPLRSAHSIEEFKKNLKTYYFRMAFS